MGLQTMRLTFLVYALLFALLHKSYSFIFLCYPCLYKCQKLSHPTSLAWDNHNRRIVLGTGRNLAVLAGKMSDGDSESLDGDIGEVEREKEHIYELVKRNAPSNFQVRLNLLGFTPLTIAGFGVAFVLLTLNAVLGNGWAANLLGLNSDSYSTISLKQRASENAEIQARMNKLRGDSVINYDDIKTRLDALRSESGGEI